MGEKKASRSLKTGVPFETQWPGRGTGLGIPDALFAATWNTLSFLAYERWEIVARTPRCCLRRRARGGG